MRCIIVYSAFLAIPPITFFWSYCVSNMGILIMKILVKMRGVIIAFMLCSVAYQYKPLIEKHVNSYSLPYFYVEKLDKFFRIKDGRECQLVKTGFDCEGVENEI